MAETQRRSATPYWDVGQDLVHLASGQRWTVLDRGHDEYRIGCGGRERRVHHIYLHTDDWKVAAVMVGLGVRARACLAGWSVVAEGSTTSWDASRAPKAGSRPPAGALDWRAEPAGFDEWARRFEREALTVELVEECEQALKHARARVEKRGMSVGEFRAHVIEKQEGIHYGEVAKAQGMSTSWVRKIREEAGRDPLWGRRKAA